MGTFEIRTPTQDDMSAVVEVHIRARRSYYEGHLPEEELVAWQDEVRAKGYRLDRFPERVWLCAEQDGEIVGFALATPDGKLWQLHVDPPHWGKGIGSALHGACTARLRELGVERAELEVFSGNSRARRFYANQGWREVSRDEDHVVLALDLAERPVGRPG